MLKDTVDVSPTLPGGLISEVLALHNAELKQKLNKDGPQKLKLPEKMSTAFLGCALLNGFTRTFGHDSSLLRFRGSPCAVSKYEPNDVRHFCLETKQLVVLRTNQNGQAEDLPEIKPGSPETIIVYISDEHSLNRALCGYMATRGWRIVAVWDGAHRYAYSI